MARSTLNTTGESRTGTRKGHGTRALGPSDSSDSDSDRYGTGERGAAGRDSIEAVDETFTEHDRDDVEAVHESIPAREAVDVESDDRPDLDVEAAEEVDRRAWRNRAP